MNQQLLNTLIKTRFGRKTDDEQLVQKFILWNDGKDYSEEEFDATFDYYWDLDSI